MSDTKSHDKAFTRRDVLRATLAVGAAALTPAIFAATPLKRAIPASGEQLPAIGLGTWQTFDVGNSEAERAPLREVLKRFVALGGTVIDSSPMYGESETVVGDLAGETGVNKSLFLATKVWTSGRDAGIRQMETSFKRLRTPKLDLMQVHNLVDWQTHLKTLRGWKEQGRVRYLAWAAEFDCASWAQFFLKFILAHPAVTCAIPATSKVKHLEDNMQAGIGRLPDAATREKMAQFIRAL